MRTQDARTQDVRTQDAPLTSSQDVGVLPVLPPLWHGGAARGGAGGRTCANLDGHCRTTLREIVRNDLVSACPKRLSSLAAMREACRGVACSSALLLFCYRRPITS